jgi:erythromycin esterase-like protein
VEALRDRLAARRDELVPISGSAAYEEALQHAIVVAQSFSVFRRDEFLASNTKWIREHRGETGRIILWAHQEHAGKTESPWVMGQRSMGFFLARELGDDYVVIGTLTASGNVRLWEQISGTTSFRTLTRAVRPPEPGSYEERFLTGPAPAILVPLRGPLPRWLEGPAPFFSIGQVPGPDLLIDSLPANLDAVIFIETTTPTWPLR